MWEKAGGGASLGTWFRACFDINFWKWEKMSKMNAHPSGEIPTFFLTLPLNDSEWIQTHEDWFVEFKINSLQERYFYCSEVYEINISKDSKEWNWQEASVLSLMNSMVSDLLTRLKELCFHKFLVIYSLGIPTFIICIISNITRNPITSNIWT